MNAFDSSRDASWWGGDAIVMSTRSRIVRNIADTPFPARASDADRSAVVSIVREAVEKGIDGMTHIPVPDAPPLTRRILIERGLIRSGSADRDVSVWVNSDESSGIIVNDDDHVRIFSTAPGSECASSYGRASENERALEGTIPFAFDASHGYLTSSPGDIGTGLRISCRVHLPFLIWERKASLEKLLTSVVRAGGLVSGVRGHKSRSIGDIIEVSNQSTLGVSERDIVDMAASFAHKITAAETKARESALKKDRVQMEDRVFRSLATLRAARSITYLETAAFLSWVRAGSHMGIVSVPIPLLTRTLIMTQKGHICAPGGELLPKADRDILRADRVREIFAPFSV